MIWREQQNSVMHMQIELASFGRFSPPPRICNRTDFDAIREKRFWNSKTENLAAKKKEYAEMEGHEDGGEQTTLTGGEDNDGEDDDEEEVQEEEQEEQEEDQEYEEENTTGKGKGKAAAKGKGKAAVKGKETAPVKKPKKKTWFDISNIEAVFNIFPMKKYLMSRKGSLQHVFATLNERNKGKVDKLPPAGTMGWKMILSIVNYKGYKSHGLSNISDYLVDAMVWEETYVKLYRKAFIREGSGGLFRFKLQEVLDLVSMNTLKSHFGIAGKVEDQYLWWDMLRAEDGLEAEYPVVDMDTLVTRITDTSAKVRIRNDFNNIAKIVENIPNICLPGQGKILPGTVGRSMTLLFTVRVRWIESLRSLLY